MHQRGLGCLNRAVDILNTRGVNSGNRLVGAVNLTVSSNSFDNAEMHAIRWVERDNGPSG